MTTESTGRCQASDILRERLRSLHDTSGLSWRKIAEIPEFKGVPAGTLCAIAKGAKVPKKWRRRLAPSGRKRYRIVAQVSKDVYIEVKAAAEMAGVTMGEWVRKHIPQKT